MTPSSGLHQAHLGNRDFTNLLGLTARVVRAGEQEVAKRKRAGKPGLSGDIQEQEVH
jgi:hypothetical protein